nr:uncharacterized protein LOC108076231 [Drosophila kikkawai]
MHSFKTLWLLGFLMIFHTSLVRCQSYNPAHIFTCAEVFSRGLAEVTKEILPKFKELIDCISFVPNQNLYELDTHDFRALVSSFLLHLAKGPSCLETFSEDMKDLINPHMKQFKIEHCAYLNIVPKCWPN